MIMGKLTEDMVIARTKTSDLATVKKLNCWGSDLVDISLVRRLTNVEVLSLSLNKIASLVDFQYCRNLCELYIRRNEIRDLSELCYLQELPRLKILLLTENPCIETASNLYRLSVLRCLPGLEVLDNVPVEPEEVEMALRSGLILEHPLTRRVNGTYNKPDRVSPEPMVYYGGSGNEIDGSQIQQIQAFSSGRRGSSQYEYDSEPVSTYRSVNANSVRRSPPITEDSSYQYQYQNGDESNKESEKEICINTNTNINATTTPTTTNLSSINDAIITTTTTTPSPTSLPITNSSPNTNSSNNNNSNSIPNCVNNTNHQANSVAGNSSGSSTISSSNGSSISPVNNNSNDLHNRSTGGSPNNPADYYGQLINGNGNGNGSQTARRGSSPDYYEEQRQQQLQRPQTSPGLGMPPRVNSQTKLKRSKGSNIVSAILCLIPELELGSLEVLEMAIRRRMEELGDD